MRASSQVIVNDIPDRLEEIVIENMDAVNMALKSGVFIRNFDSCLRFNGMVRCNFYDKCHSNTNEGLVDMTGVE
jgi:hypothetical protein